MRLVEAAKPTFARHETFHPRYGWFRKAYAATKCDPHIFIREDAPALIGVGKNMVRAIRFWGLAAKLIDEDRPSGWVPTKFGHALFGKSGWDPYMEDPGTLWLLHWQLLAPPSLLPVWWIAFNEFHAVEFTDEVLDHAVTVGLDSVGEWKKPHPSSVRKDVNALLRTYAPAERSKRSGHSIDDRLDCPLRELGLIRRSQATGSYRFVLGEKPTLPPAIVSYAVLDYLAYTKTGGNTATLSRLAHEPGAPGHAFKLTEADLFTALQQTATTTDALELASPTGVPQLSWSGNLADVANEVLSSYYDTASETEEGAGDQYDTASEPEGGADDQYDTALETEGSEGDQLELFGVEKIAG